MGEPSRVMAGACGIAPAWQGRSRRRLHRRRAPRYSLTLREADAYILPPFESLSPVNRTLATAALLGLLATTVAACATSEDGTVQPPATLAFPTGVALTPEDPALPQRLLVVSSNFDLRYRAGRLHAFDRAAIDALADEAPPSPSCPATQPRCLPADVPSLQPALVGTVEVGDFGGEVGVATLGPGRMRAFVPVRGSQSVVAADLDAQGISCSQGGGGDCAGTGASFPRRDPYSIAVALGNVYVGHFTLNTLPGTGPKGGVIGTAPADASFWTLGGGAMAEVPVGRESAIGGLSVGTCRPSGDGPLCTLFASGRSRMGGTQEIFAFDFQAGVPMASPLFSRNLFSQEFGFDSRGIAAASSGAEVFMASRSPNALAVIDVTRLATLPTDGCIVPEGEVVAPGAACPDLPPPTGETPSFRTLDLVPSPNGPNAVAVLPRALPGGGTSDLVVMTTDGGLAFFDTRAPVLAADLGGLGTTPSAIAARPAGTGFRLYVPSFLRGTLAVVDVPDPFRPETARVVARIGPVQEGT